MPVLTAAQAAVRVCLYCPRDFIPGEGWRAVYCSDGCRRANNAGATERAKPLTAIPPEPAPPPAPTPAPASRLVITGREWCDRCQADHDVYGTNPGGGHATVTKARPMPPDARQLVYQRGRRALTPAQRRRVRHKAGRARKRARRQEVAS